MKRRDLIKKINEIAKDRNITPIWSEGGSHTKVKLDDLTITVPRHKEIKESLARKIIRDAQD